MHILGHECTIVVRITEEWWFSSPAGEYVTLEQLLKHLRCRLDDYRGEDRTHKVEVIRIEVDGQPVNLSDLGLSEQEVKGE
jgi:hypothetical protein